MGLESMASASTASGGLLVGHDVFLDVDMLALMASTVRAMRYWMSSSCVPALLK